MRLSSCGKKLDHIFDGFVGAVIDGFQAAVGLMVGISVLSGRAALMVSKMA